MQFSVCDREPHSPGRQRQITIPVVLDNIVGVSSSPPGSCDLSITARTTGGKSTRVGQFVMSAYFTACDGQLLLLFGLDRCAWFDCPRWIDHSCSSYEALCRRCHTAKTSGRAKPECDGYKIRENLDGIFRVVRMASEDASCHHIGAVLKQIAELREKNETLDRNEDASTEQRAKLDGICSLHRNQMFRSTKKCISISLYSHPSTGRSIPIHDPRASFCH